MSCCQIHYNSELQINESHNNNFIFFIDHLPISFLISKFSEDCLTRLGPSPLSYGKNANKEAIREANNDISVMSLYLKDFSIPGVELGTTGIPSPLVDIQSITGKMKFGSFRTNFMNDENWFIYRMFLYWLYAGYNPEENMKYTEKQYARSFYTDAHLVILDNNRDKVMEWKFMGCHPKNIGQIAMNYANPEKITIPIEWIFTGFTPSDEVHIFKKV